MGLSRVSVEVRGGDIGKALKVFKRKVEASGHLLELKQRKEYTKPTTKRRLVKQKAIRKNQLEVEIERERNRY
jgi:small subunit ribosomal protein S21